jgi:pilus assembly protein TadC
MSEHVIGLLWAGLVIAARRRPFPAVRQRLAVTQLEPPTRGRADPFGVVGAAVLRVSRRPGSPARARQIGTALAFAVMAGVVDVRAVVPAAAGGWIVPAVRARALERRRLDAYAAGLAEVVDLLALAVGAGLTVALAVDAVARRATGPLATELGRVREEVALGRRLADALEDLPGRCGEAVRPMVAALVASERYGAPLAAGLDRLAHEVRLERRRQAEEAVRKVPVKLLFPLVTCTLPAFALLTVAPLLASAIRSLRL